MADTVSYPTLPELRFPPLAVDPQSPLQIKEIVYRRLVRAIVELRLHPGEQLRERQLAEQMGVSKTPIREALVRLEKEGLLRLEYGGVTIVDLETLRYYGD